MGRFIDLTGMKFNRLTVLKRADNYVDKNGRQFVRWFCRCDCGSTIVVKGDALRSGNTGSYGCLARDTVTLLNKTIKKKYNNYDLSGDYGIGFTSNGGKFYFDLEDFDVIKEYCWCIDTKGYVVANEKNHNQTLYLVKLHRLIMGCNKYDGLYVDHINHNKIDNRKINLRIVTNQQNCRNRSLQKNNKSGTSGVRFDEKIGKWTVKISDNKQIYLGSYSTLEEAIKVRKQAEEQYYKEYSYDNSMACNTLYSRKEVKCGCIEFGIMKKRFG